MKILKLLIVLFFVTGNMFAQQTQGAGGGFPKNTHKIFTTLHLFASSTA